MTTFADRLRDAMISADMTQKELAKRSGCTRSSISQYLSQTNIPRPAKIEALAEVLGVSPDYLTGEAEEDEEPMPPMIRIGTRTAARCMGKSDKFVRKGLQLGSFSFGVAVPLTDKRWSYYINPVRFRDFVGKERFNEFFGAANRRKR